MQNTYSVRNGEQKEARPEGPASSVLPPASALRLLHSRALSSEQADCIVSGRCPLGQHHPDAHKAVNPRWSKSLIH